MTDDEFPFCSSPLTISSFVNYFPISGSHCNPKKHTRQLANIHNHRNTVGKVKTGFPSKAIFFVASPGFPLSSSSVSSLFSSPSLCLSALRPFYASQRPRPATCHLRRDRRVEDCKDLGCCCRLLIFRQTSMPGVLLLWKVEIKLQFWSKNPHFMSMCRSCPSLRFRNMDSNQRP